MIPFLTFVLGWQVGIGAKRMSKKEICSAYCENLEKKGKGIIENFLGKKEKEKSPLDLTIFWMIYDKIKKDFVHSEEFKNKQKIVHFATKGLVASLEVPFSYFMTPEENEDFNIDLDDELEGIGAALTLREKVLVIENVLKNTPAERVGLKPEDIILKINGESTENQSLKDSVHKIRGKKGTAVKLTIFRQDENEPFDVEITRDKITVESVTSEEKAEGKIIYVSVNKFSDGTVAEFRKVASKILLKNYEKGMILDLRFNGGGYLQAAVDMASEFIKKGIVVTSRTKTETEIKKVSGKGKLFQIPLVILVNKGTASASEILAGAVQDYERGKVLGEQTFGKGTVQEVETFFDKSSLRLTIAEWLTPKNRAINKEGLKPDIVVKRSLEDFKEKRDPQLDAAVELLLTGEVSEKYLESDEKEKESSDKEDNNKEGKEEK